MGDIKLFYKLLILNVILSVVMALSGGQPGGFLSYGTNARSIGLGRAFLAIANDASAVIINPAGMIQVKSMEASLFQTGLYDGYSLMGFNFVYPQVNNTLGFSFTQLASEPMDYVIKTMTAKEHLLIHKWPSVFLTRNQFYYLNSQSVFLENLLIEHFILILTLEY